MNEWREERQDFAEDWREDRQDLWEDVYDDHHYWGDWDDDWWDDDDNGWVWGLVGGVVGYAIGAKLNAWLPQAGFTPTLTDFYLVAGCLPLIPLLLLIGLDPDGVVARKLADQRRAALALP